MNHHAMLSYAVTQLQRLVRVAIQVTFAFVLWWRSGNRQTFIPYVCGQQCSGPKTETHRPTLFSLASLPPPPCLVGSAEDTPLFMDFGRGRGEV